jgi:WD40 repeat protein
VSDLKELFEMVTKQTEPDVDAWRKQEERHRRRATTRRLGAFAAVAVIAVGALVAAVELRGSDQRQPLHSSAPHPAIMAGASLVAIDAVTGDAQQIIADIDAYRTAVSPDGTRIAFVRGVGGHPAIFLAEIDGSRARQVTGLPGQPGCACGSFDPAWSPDGTQLAYTGTSDAGNRDVFVLDVGTGDARRVTHWHGDSFESSPAWSADGRTIAFAAGPWNAGPAGSGWIYTVPASGGRPHLIVHRRGATDPTWAGTTIAFSVVVNGSTSLELVDLTTDDTARSVSGEAPAFSPDGTELAFADGSEVNVLTVATGEIRALGTGGDPAWSPDGTTIYAWRS